MVAEIQLKICVDAQELMEVMEGSIGVLLTNKVISSSVLIVLGIGSSEE